MFESMSKSFVAGPLHRAHGPRRSYHSSAERVIRVVHHLFKGFLESDAEYRRAQEFWRVLVDGIADQEGQQGEWQPWGTRTFVDGSHVPRDLLPIFQARSGRLQRSVQILQSVPVSDAPELAAWVEHLEFYREPEHVWECTDELVVNLALSDEVIDSVRRLLVQWMDPGISRERMEDLIKEQLR